jgi:hypothetical protein
MCSLKGERKPDKRVIADFLKRILPERGLRCIGTRWRPGADALRHQFFATNDEAAEAIAHFAAFENVWHANATFRTPENRTGQNAERLRALWGDIDVEAGNGLKYQSQREAAVDFLRWSKDSEWPEATLITSSGGGLHIYWAFDCDLTPTEWRPYAFALKVAARKHGLKLDFKCTADAVRVLRPAGSWNHKPVYETPRPVEILFEGPTHAREAFAKHLTSMKPPIFHRPVQRLTFNRIDDRRLTDALLVIPVAGLDEELAGALNDWVLRGYDSPYGMWSSVGGAIKASYGDAAFDLFDAWSSGDPERYEGTEATRRKWDQLNYDRVSAQTVFKLAEDIKHARRLLASFKAMGGRDD